MARDYIAEMGDRLAEAMADGDFVAPALAEKLHAHLLETDPDLLDGWLREGAVHFLTRAIGDRDRNERSAARSRGGARRFKEASDAAQAGNDAALSMFATVRYVIDEGETRRTLGDMTGADHLFVADGYKQTAANARMLEAFHRAVGKRVGKRKTCDVFTEAEYQKLYDSITGRSPGSGPAVKAA
jgi:hypothetical protein